MTTTKDLIELARKGMDCGTEAEEQMVKDLADALERLQAERDAAVTKLDLSSAIDRNIGPMLIQFAILRKALCLAKQTFIDNKMDVRNVMEVIDEAIAATGKAKTE